MNLHIRQNPPRNGKHAGIRNNERVRADRPQLSEIFLHAWKVPIMGENIRGNINLHAPVMSEGNPFPDLVVGEIFRLGPQAEGLSSQVDRVRTVDHRRFQRIQAPGWN